MNLFGSKITKSISSESHQSNLCRDEQIDCDEVCDEVSIVSKSSIINSSVNIITDSSETVLWRVSPRDSREIHKARLRRPAYEITETCCNRCKKRKLIGKINSRKRKELKTRSRSRPVRRSKSRKKLSRKNQHKGNY